MNNKHSPIHFPFTEQPFSSMDRAFAIAKDHIRRLDFLRATNTFEWPFDVAIQNLQHSGQACLYPGVKVVGFRAVYHDNDDRIQLSWLTRPDARYCTASEHDTRFIFLGLYEEYELYACEDGDLITLRVRMGDKKQLKIDQTFSRYNPLKDLEVVGAMLEAWRRAAGLGLIETEQLAEPFISLFPYYPYLEKYWNSVRTISSYEDFYYPLLRYVGEKSKVVQNTLFQNTAQADQAALEPDFKQRVILAKKEKILELVEAACLSLGGRRFNDRTFVEQRLRRIDTELDDLITYCQTSFD